MIDRYDYETLKSYARRGEAVGKWNGISVYTCSKEGLQKIDLKNCYYIIYDDKNVLFRNGYKHGNVAINGDIYTCAPIPYIYKEVVEYKEEVVDKPEQTEWNDNILDNILDDVVGLLDSACKW